MIRRSLLYLILLMAALAACDTAIPTAPPITVNITAVENSTALAQSVSEAITATAQVNIGLTETVLAQGGITLTPSNTPTLTPTLTLSPTRFVTATPTPRPSETPTPTFAPFQTITPSAEEVASGTGWLRLINLTRGDTAVYDVLFNEDQVARSIEPDAQTNYFQVNPGAVRVSLGAPAQVVEAATPPPPLASAVVDVPAGGIVTVLVVPNDAGIELLPIVENPAPLPTGESRLTIVQTNAILPPLDFMVPTLRVMLVNNLVNGEIAGPYDLPAGEYPFDLYDEVREGQVIANLLPVTLLSQSSYILVLLPSPNPGEQLTEIRLLTGFTRSLDTDVRVRFVNALETASSIQAEVDGQLKLSQLPYGGVSDPVTVSSLGANLVVSSVDRQVLLDGALTALSADDRSDRLIIISENPQAGTPGQQPAVLTILPQNPPPSIINARVRLVHALPNGVPLILQVRPQTNGSVLGATEVPWASIGQADFGTASDYLNRNPGVYSVRVLLSTNQSPIGILENIQFLAGGVYDFMIVPGQEPGSAVLKLVEPSIQVTELVTGKGNPTAVFEAVAATLTSQAPVSTATPTRAFTPTPTRTPVPTNTPRPTNTPNFLPPILLVNPAPPNTALGSVNLTGQNFQPGQAYVVTLDNDTRVISSGTVNEDGTILVTVQLPENLAPGSHIIQVCVDCRPRGAQQLALAVFLARDARITPTATAQP
ncbi:MAG: DUF4397 domain-containing protein [Anaerolineae bacterium]|nr:DUF4397 domain-containing protein [Anaerolineae bacterium]